MEWNGSFEKYFLISLDNGTVKLQAEVQAESEWKDHMNEGFTKGLQIVKDLAESN
ncbi:hypothetical protein D3C78_1904310 [compost metagenome]